MSNEIVILDKKQAELDDCQSIDSFQKEMQSNIAFSSQVSSLIFSSIRREYMENSNFLKVGKLVSNGINCNPIVWIKITEIGLFDKNQAIDIHAIMEQLLQSLHLPEHYRILFEVSSNAKFVEVKLGVQSVTASKIYDNVSMPDPYLEVFAKNVGDFAKINFPGLKYEIVLGNNSNENAMVQSLKNEENASIRCITGLPSFRDKNQQTEFASIDRLANALQEYKWSYIVIAEPIVNQVVDQILNTSLDLAGKIESMKSFQIGKSLSEANSETGGTSEYGIPFSGLIREALSLFSDILCTEQQSKNVVEEIRKATLGKSQSSSFSITNGATMNQNIINKYAEHTAKLIDAQVARLRLTEALGAWDVGCYFVAENDHVADTGAAIIKSLSSGDVSWYEPLRTHNLCTPLWELAVINKTQDNPFDILQKYENPNVVAFDKESQNSIIHPFDTANIHLFSYYRTLLNSRELSQLINFPTQSMPGVITHRVLSDTGLSVQDSDGKLNFGKQVYRGAVMEKFPYYINPDSFSKHSLVCGISRSGKTNTIIGVLNEMQKKQIPFMVIEPAKQEYVEWAIQQNKMLEKELGSVEKAQSDPRWINIYIPGRESFRGTDLEKLYLNPFDFVWLNEKEEPKTAEHIDRLKTVINAALPMYEILPVLMEELIYSAYSVKHARLSENDKYPSWLFNIIQE